MKKIFLELPLGRLWTRFKFCFFNWIFQGIWTWFRHSA